jgi:hypothetical protein
MSWVRIQVPRLLELAGATVVVSANGVRARGTRIAVAPGANTLVIAIEWMSSDGTVRCELSAEIVVAAGAEVTVSVPWPTLPQAARAPLCALTKGVGMK